MSKYSPILKKVWDSLASKKTIQQILKYETFVFEMARQSWQQIDAFTETEGFYMQWFDTPDQLLNDKKISQTPFGTILHNFLSSLIQGKSQHQNCINRQLAPYKHALIKQILLYKYNQNSFSQPDSLLEKVRAYLDNPFYEVPIFAAAHRDKIDDNVLPLQLDYLGNTFNQKCLDLWHTLGIHSQERANDTFLLAEWLLHPDIVKIWQLTDKDIYQQELSSVGEPEAIYLAQKATPPRPQFPHNQILYGVAGTGKTYHARKLALEISQNADCIEFVTFHPSFFYEDFIEGIKPIIQANGLAYQVRDGIFKRCCQRAQANPDQNHVLIIDEINRGNIPQIFGELITLLESDKRSGAAQSIDLQLPYSQTRLSVPPNLYIIGTMNTSDKSIMQLDLALRRRFIFKELRPQIELLTQHIEGIEIAALLAAINARLELLLDKDHLIGHAYLLDVATLHDLRQVFEYQLLPLLEEYFLGDWSKIQYVVGEAFVERTDALQSPFAGRLVEDAVIAKKQYRPRVFDADFPHVRDFQQIYASY